MTVAAVQSESETWSKDYIQEQAYLVSRGVRPMAIVGWVTAEHDVMLRAASRLEIESIGIEGAAAYVIPRPDGQAVCGFAAARWVIDLHEWVLQTPALPEKHFHHILGLLLGYSAHAIRDHDEREGGRRFTRK